MNTSSGKEKGRDISSLVYFCFLAINVREVTGREVSGQQLSKKFLKVHRSLTCKRHRMGSTLQCITPVLCNGSFRQISGMLSIHHCIDAEVKQNLCMILGSGNCSFKMKSIFVPVHCKPNTQKECNLLDYLPGLQRSGCNSLFCHRMSLWCWARHFGVNP